MARLTDADFNSRLSDADFLANTASAPRLSALNSTGRVPGTNIDIPTGTTLDKYKQAKADTENTILNRRSLLHDMISDPTTMQRLKDHPFTTALRTLGGAAEGLEGSMADAALAAQSGDVSNLGRDLAKTWTGQRPAQIGDVLRASGNDTLMNPAVASTVGLLTTGLRGTPTAGLGDVVGAAASPVTNTLKAAYNKAIQPGVTDFLSRWSGVTPKILQKAIDNPEYLDNSYVSKLGQEVKPEFDSVVKSLENDPKATVQLTGASQLLNPANPKGLGMMTQLGVASSKMGSMTEAQRQNLEHFATSIDTAAQKPTSFNAARRMLVEMDKDLKGYYSAIQAGQAPHADVYEGILTQMRNAVREDIGTQYPQYGQVAEKMSNYMDAKNVLRTMENGKGSFFRSLPERVGASAAGIPGAISALGAFVGSTPAGQRSWILNAARLKSLESLPLGAIIANRGSAENSDNNQ